MTRRYALALAALTWATPVFALELPGADDKAVPCRPTVSCTADLAAPGTSELEAGFLFKSLAAAGNQSSYPFLTKFTLAPWSQLQIGSNGYTQSRGAAAGQFFDDLTVGGKFHLLDQSAPLPSLSFSATASLPTARNQSAYTRAYDAFFVLYASRDFGALHADFNVGLNLWNLDTSALSQGFVALALSTTLTGPLSLALEGYWFSDASPAASHDAGVRTALTWAARPWLVVDVGADAGLYSALRTYSAFTGLTVVPAVLWRPTPR